MTLLNTAGSGPRLEEVTPWDGRARPGKCLLSPDMVMIAYTVATIDDDRASDRIRALKGRQARHCDHCGHSGAHGHSSGCSGGILDSVSGSRRRP